MTAQTAPFDGKAHARSLSTRPGVYRMLDAAGAMLYVGKAKNLRKRVGSYFQRPQLEPRIARMLTQVAAVEVTLTRTEAEALLLENELIKSLKPRYNILLRDQKSFPYIYLSSKQEFPRLGFHRGARDQPGRYFGPFPSAGAVRESLNQLHRVFRIRGCEDSYFKNRSRPCLQYQIGRCTAPCVGLIDAEHYRQDVRHLELFLEGKSSVVLDELGRLMDQASAALEFERAARLRDEIAQVKQTQARQAVAGIEQDADVLACRIEEGVACVQLLYFRNGMNLGTRSYFPRLPPGDVKESEVLGAFLGQYYLERPPPPLILLSHAPEDQELLATVLGERRGARVELRVAVRGDRARLVEMVAENAANALATELAGQQSQTERWRALANLLCDGKEPEQVECFDISHTQGEAAVASCVVFGPRARASRCTGVTTCARPSRETTTARCSRRCRGGSGTHRRARRASPTCC
jgi:excinuclease ABC subunit C